MRKSLLLSCFPFIFFSLQLLQLSRALSFSSNKCISVPTDVNLAPFYCNASLPPFFKVCASNPSAAAAKAKTLYASIPPSFAACASIVTSACSSASTKPLFTPMPAAPAAATSAPSTTAALPTTTAAPPATTAPPSSNATNSSSTPATPPPPPPPPPPPRVATAADFIGPEGLSPCLCCSFLPVATLMQCDEDSHCSGDRDVKPCADDCVSTWTAMCTLMYAGDSSANASASSGGGKLDEYNLITRCMENKIPFQTNGENDYVCLRTSQLILDHPKCASQWAEHSSRPLKFNVLVMIIVLVASFCTGLMLDFIHVKRW